METNKLQFIIDELQERNYQLTLEKKQLLKVVEALHNELKRIKKNNRPLRINGWTVSDCKDGYYRLYKKINGKSESLYLGKDFDYHNAIYKIKDKESQK